MKPEDLKGIVKEKYGEIASENITEGNSCCCNKRKYSVFSDDYTSIKGYNPEADLGLGCGLPTEFAGIREGDHVLDLGSGAGNDCFVARSLTGDSGKVTGLDFTDSMIEKAEINLKKTGYSNVEFIKGDIEQMPLTDKSYDVVISNCVLNLVPDKDRAFSEIYRVMKPGGHFCVSDVILQGDLPGNLKKAAEMYAGCVSGAVDRNIYLSIINEQGFKNITIHKETERVLPDDILKEYLSENEIDEFRKSGTGLFSITVTAVKE